MMSYDKLLYEAYGYITDSDSRLSAALRAAKTSNDISTLLHYAHLLKSVVPSNRLTQRLIDDLGIEKTIILVENDKKTFRMPRNILLNSVDSIVVSFVEKFIEFMKPLAEKYGLQRSGLETARPIDFINRHGHLHPSRPYRVSFFLPHYVLSDKAYASLDIRSDPTISFNGATDMDDNGHYRVVEVYYEMDAAHDSIKAKLRKAIREISAKFDKKFKDVSVIRQSYSY
jgi:hypothetical protein